MQSYSLRRGHYKNIEGVRLKDVMEVTFGPVQEEGSKFVASYGALAKITAWADKNAVYVDTETNPNVDEETAVRTRQAWNAFLERATGYEAKARAKKVQKAAKKGTEEAENVDV